MIAEVIPFLRLPSSLPCLDYRVPEDLRITVGSLVKIPFRSRGVYGVVRDKKVTSEIPEGRLSAISRSFGDSPFWGSEFMSVMQNAAEIYHCNPPLLWKTFFPSFPAKITEIFPDPVKKSNKAETKILFGRNNTEERALWYSKFIRDELSNGEQVLLLVPRKAQINELTELLARNGVKDIFSYYGDLGVTAAWEAMSKFRLGRAKVLIGTRMAAALPALNLHTIIIHDEHAEDHKQSDMQPRYDARSIAWLRNFYENAGLILSSPAPRAETVFRARNGTLKPIFWPGEPITPEIINLSHETKKGNYSLFSEILIEKIS